MKNRNDLIGILIKKIRMLVVTVESQSIRLSHLNSQSIHAMEVNQENGFQSDAKRRNELCDQDLRIDLENQYGRTNWANKIIDEILTKRIEAREVRNIGSQ